jgi:L-lactate dehydrogenase complex protein LldF
VTSSRAAPMQDRVATALANSARLVNIQVATERFSTGRRKALDELPDSEAIRDLARAIRAHTISRLDTYLLQFERAFTALGGTVHWARDAEEAREVVVGIAKGTGVRRIVKSKSMVTEEIGLNAALEAAGLEVVETDLGEYIAQLSGDRPSHLIAPVLHLTRQEVGRIFEQKLGVPYTDSIPELTAIARHKLREAFLAADMGITGCNFAVAETGTICLVTNEGNGRMVTSLPRVHVAVMGMERLVPTVTDLGVMLQLLARSATGQRLSSYTSWVTGPRRSGDAYAPRESHVVIVDNGRSTALAGDLAEILYCIRCGACLNACPVYRTIGGHAYGSVYAGPVGSVVSPVLGGLPAFPELPYASTLCGACHDACPVRIDLPALLLRLRRDAVQQGLSRAWVTAGMRGYAWMAGRSRRYDLATALAGLLSRLTRGRWISRLPGPIGGWTRHRAFPPFARRTFQRRYEEASHE